MFHVHAICMCHFLIWFWPLIFFLLSSFVNSIYYFRFYWNFFSKWNKIVSFVNGVVMWDWNSMRKSTIGKEDKKKRKTKLLIELFFPSVPHLLYLSTFAFISLIVPLSLSLSLSSTFDYYCRIVRCCRGPAMITIMSLCKTGNGIQA